MVQTNRPGKPNSSSMARCKNSYSALNAVLTLLDFSHGLLDSRTDISANFMV